MEVCLTPVSIHSYPQTTPILLSFLPILIPPPLLYLALPPLLHPVLQPLRMPLHLPPSPPAIIRIPFPQPSPLPFFPHPILSTPP